MDDHGCPAKFSHIEPCCCHPIAAQCLADGAVEHPQAKASRCAADTHARHKAVVAFTDRVLADALETHGDLTCEQEAALSAEAQAEALRHLEQEDKARETMKGLIDAETAMLEDLVLARTGQIRVPLPEPT